MTLGVAYFGERFEHEPDESTVARTRDAHEGSALTLTRIEIGAERTPRSRRSRFGSIR